MTRLGWRAAVEHGTDPMFDNKLVQKKFVVEEQEQRQKTQ